MAAHRKIEAEGLEANTYCADDFGLVAGTIHETKGDKSYLYEAEKFACDPEWEYSYCVFDNTRPEGIRMIYRKHTKDQNFSNVRTGKNWIIAKAFAQLREAIERVNNEDSEN